jgi:hypothetical protein
VNHRVTAALTLWYRHGRPRLEPKTRSGVELSCQCPSYSSDRHGAPLAVRTRSGDLKFWDHSTEEERNEATSMRLHGPCVRQRCHYWADSCQLGVLLTQTFEESADADPKAPSNWVPTQCPIRSTCRWHLENGETACSACFYVDYLMPASR